MHKTKLKNTMQRIQFKFIYAIVLLFMLGQSIAFSQKYLKTLRVSAVNESTSVPYGQLLFSPVHPGITVGTDFWLKDKTAWFQSLGIDAGYYYHELYEHAIMLDAVYNFGYTFSFGLRLKTIGALGYKHSILTGETYVLKNGEYVKKQHPGQPQVNTKIGVGMEFPVNKKFSITTDYSGMISLPYSPDLGMPFATQALIRLGFKINLQ